MIVSVFDYGAGNPHSLVKVLEGGGATVRVESDASRLGEADALVRPGVGGFAQAAGRLAPARSTMKRAIAAGLPTLGVCLGLQLLFDGSDEGAGDGLAIIPGRVTALKASRVPQLGWNTIDDADDPLFAAAPLGVAFVHAWLREAAACS